MLIFACIHSPNSILFSSSYKPLTISSARVTVSSCVFPSSPSLPCSSSCILPYCSALDTFPGPYLSSYSSLKGLAGIIYLLVLRWFSLILCLLYLLVLLCDKPMTIPPGSLHSSMDILCSSLPSSHPCFPLLLSDLP